MLLRDRSQRYMPHCPTRIAPVDQYMMQQVDTTERTCQNGVSHPIYACNGDISRTLPLTYYPKVNEIHPQIYDSSQPHFESRDRATRAQIERNQLALSGGIIEGLYMHGSGEYDPYKELEMRRLARNRQ
jgi:hypothetical protein